LAQQSKWLVEMTKDIHFDPNHPENHKFTITNQRAGMAKVMEDGEWKPKPCEEVFEDVIYASMREMEDFLQQKADYLTDKFPNIVEKTNEWWDKVGTSQFDEKEQQRLLKMLHEMVIMNRHVVGKV
jgi:hypothetical protein